MDKQKELNKIAREIENCEVCKTGKSGKAVPGEGSPDAKVIFIGEAPGKTEALTGRPFVGRSGRLLRQMITSVGLKEEEVFITSPVKYLPDRGNPIPADISHGREHLLNQLRIIRPELVVLLGRVAAEGVLKRKFYVMKDHGKVIEDIEEVRYFLTLHPAAVVRFAKYRPIFEEDFIKLKRLL